MLPLSIWQVDWLQVNHQAHICSVNSITNDPFQVFALNIQKHFQTLHSSFGTWTHLHLHLRAGVCLLCLNTNKVCSMNSNDKILELTVKTIKTNLAYIWLKIKCKNKGMAPLQCLSHYVTSFMIGYKQFFLSTFYMGIEFFLANFLIAQQVLTVLIQGRVNCARTR